MMKPSSVLTEGRSVIFHDLSIRDQLGNITSASSLQGERTTSPDYHCFITLNCHDIFVESLFLKGGGGGHVCMLKEIDNSS